MHWCSVSWKPTMNTIPTVHLDIQNACQASGIPDTSEFIEWVSRALAHRKIQTHRACELTLRIVDTEEITQLNRNYRGKDGATNVLSFPFEYPPGIPDDPGQQILGDILICAPIMQEESLEQNKSIKAHWAHLIIHGTLHLLGYDHVDDTEAQQMEQLETQLLADLKFPDPYQQ